MAKRPTSQPVIDQDAIDAFFKATMPTATTGPAPATDLYTPDEQRAFATPASTPRPPMPMTPPAQPAFQPNWAQRMMGNAAAMMLTNPVGKDFVKNAMDVRKAYGQGASDVYAGATGVGVGIPAVIAAMMTGGAAPAAATAIPAGAAGAAGAAAGATELPAAIQTALKLWGKVPTPLKWLGGAWLGTKMVTGTADQMRDLKNDWSLTVPELDEKGKPIPGKTRAATREESLAWMQHQAKMSEIDAEMQSRLQEQEVARKAQIEVMAAQRKANLEDKYWALWEKNVNAQEARFQAKQQLVMQSMQRFQDLMDRNRQRETAMLPQLLGLE